MKRIELATLKGACQEQRDRFAELFPKGVIPTEELAIKHASDFNWDWAALHLLSKEAQADYERIRVAAYADYLLSKEAHADYLRIEGLAWDAYLRIQGPAWDAYLRIERPALANYKRAIAIAFVRAWRAQ